MLLTSERPRRYRRPGCSLLHPARELCYNAIRQLLVGRHLDVGVSIAKRPDQQTFVCIAGNDGGSTFSALEQGSAGVEAQAMAGLLSAVTLETLLRQNGPN